MQAVLDEFVRLNHWHGRQQEIVRRKDRDGECFLRLFPAADGTTRLRFVEPAEVATPTERVADPSSSFGIQTEPEDVETVLGYWIGGRLVDAAEIQHRKANVDANVQARPAPLLSRPQEPPPRREAAAEHERRGRNSVGHRHHPQAPGGDGRGPGAFRGRRGRPERRQPRTGRTSHFRRYAPGTILDAMAGTDYQFPAAGIDAGRYVAVLQAELRAIASRLVMPEFMLTSDASNANYSSTMVAEGPAVKMFDRLQHEMLEEDLALLRRVLSHAASRAGYRPRPSAAWTSKAFRPGWPSATG